MFVCSEVVLESEYQLPVFLISGWFYDCQVLQAYLEEVN